MSESDLRVGRKCREKGFMVEVGRTPAFMEQPMEEASKRD